MYKLGESYSATEHLLPVTPKSTATTCLARQSRHLHHVDRVNKPCVVSNIAPGSEDLFKRPQRRRPSPQTTAQTRHEPIVPLKRTTGDMINGTANGRPTTTNVPYRVAHVRDSPEAPTLLKRATKEDYIRLMAGSPNASPPDQLSAMRNANNDVDTALEILQTGANKTEVAFHSNSSQGVSSIQPQTRTFTPVLGVYTPGAGSFVPICLPSTGPRNPLSSPANGLSRCYEADVLTPTAKAPMPSPMKQYYPANYLSSFQIPPPQSPVSLRSSEASCNVIQGEGTSHFMIPPHPNIDLRAELIHRLNEIEWLSQTLEKDPTLQHQYQFSLRGYHYALHKWQNILLEKEMLVKGHHLALQQWQNIMRNGHRVLNGYNASLRNWQTSLENWQASMREWQASLQILEPSVYSHRPAYSSNISYRCEPSTITPSLPLSSSSPLILQKPTVPSHFGIRYTLSTRLESEDATSMPMIYAAVHQPKSELDLHTLGLSKKAQGGLHLAQLSPTASYLEPRGLNSDSQPSLGFQRITNECVLKKEPKL